MDDALGQSSSEPSMSDLMAALEASEQVDLPEGVEAQEADDPEEPDDIVDDDDTPVTVSQKELKELRDGQLRMKDYTQKTQEVAEFRRVAEKESEAIKARAAEVDKVHNVAISRLSQYEKFLQADLPKPPSAALATTDPQRYVAEDAYYKEKLAKLQGVHNALEQEKQAKAQNDSKARDKEMDLVWETLVKSQPGWSDPAKAAAGTDAVIKFALSEGMTRDELAKQTSPAFWAMALKAQKLAQLNAFQAERKAKQTKTQTGAPARPGVSQPNAAQSQRQSNLAKAFRAEPNVKNALAMAEHMNI